MPRKAANQPEQEILPPESEASTELAILTPQTAVTVLQDNEKMQKMSL